MERINRLLVAYADGSAGAVTEAISAASRTAPWHVTYLADLVVDRLELLDEPCLTRVTAIAEVHPARWRSVLRQHLDMAGPRVSLAAGRLLEPIGEREDIARLRRLAKAARRNSADAELGRGLARRVAHVVHVEDQGRVVVRTGEAQIPGTSIRRKVLALLCLMLTRSGKAMTRDQVLDALWPDLDPGVAVNSLNQTVYFLRRVFEKDYVEDHSPGYIHHDSEVLWLDAELVSSDSSSCWSFIKSLSPRPTPDEVSKLVGMYRGRFALDFEYEEWAGDYRDALHASYLEIVERSVRSDLETGHYDRGIQVARQALETDPGAEQIEITLLRLYRQTGAHAAAAEQYSHYAGMLRDELGIDPPTLESL